MHPLYYKIRRRLVLPLPLHRLLTRGQPEHRCPICEYRGTFRNYNPGTGKRKWAQCPGCKALERHRLQFLVLEKILPSQPDLAVLHIAPEPFLRSYFSSKNLASYITSDISMRGVDCHSDLCHLPFQDSSFDLVFASHVLEHISDDHAAIGEISRVLREGGKAILPVPIICDKTVEYGKANPFEEHHVRAPGPDYFDRYSGHFKLVETFESNGFSSAYQVFNLEQRSAFPNKQSPLRTAMQGDKHADYVPVCSK